MLRIVGCLAREHDPYLVLLAIAVGGLACFTALGLLSRAASHAAWHRRIWLLASAATFGCGVWSMHFIAMLAFRPQATVHYELTPTVVSLAVAVAAGLPALGLFLHRPRSGIALLLSGALLGAGVSSMHFVGMMALRSSGILHFDLLGVLAAAGIAIAGATAALWAWRSRLWGLATLALVAAIALMHCTAMAALAFFPFSPGRVPAGVVNVHMMAAATFAVCLLIVTLRLAGAWFDRYAAQRIKDEASRFRQLADAAFEGILILRDGLVADCNRAACQLLQQSADELIGQPVKELVDLAGLELADGQATASMAETTLRVATAAGHPIEVAVRPLDDRGETVVLSMRDIADRKAAAQEIQRLVYQDPVTGLGNRALLTLRAGEALAAAQAAGMGVTFLYLDLDRFKSINDTFGHPVGDKVLALVGQRLRSCMREADTIVRLGGDEFAVVSASSSCRVEDAMAQAKRIIERVCDVYHVDGHDITMATSIGIALYPNHGSRMDDLIRKADMALYQAKREGRGTYRLFHEDIDSQARERRALEQQLRRAVADNEFYLEYQAVFDSRTLAVSGYEALIRWDHPDRGLVSPGCFIPVAEEIGLIRPIGRWVLETACAAAMQWPTSQFVAVNISPAQFRGHDLVDEVSSILRRTGLPPERLEIEITEGILIEDSKRTLAALNALRELGVRFSLDDFGIGYSSLAYLHRFRFDKIKVDRSFVEALDVDPEAAVIIRSIVALGHSLRIEVTAEGVETAAQLDWIRQHHCDHVQGFLLAKPVRNGAIPKLPILAETYACSRAHPEPLEV